MKAKQARPGSGNKHNGSGNNNNSGSENNGGSDNNNANSSSSGCITDIGSGRGGSGNGGGNTNGNTNGSSRSFGSYSRSSGGKGSSRSTLLPGKKVILFAVDVTKVKCI
jgi:hypothetical protein